MTCFSKILIAIGVVLMFAVIVVKTKLYTLVEEKFLSSEQSVADEFLKESTVMDANDKV